VNARALTLPVVVAIALVIAGCGERPQVTVYKQGQYKGKPDNLPWQSQPFNGSQHDWEIAIDGRTKKQNEYARIENQ
jgi:hypothetical protein